MTPHSLDRLLEDLRLRAVYQQSGRTLTLALMIIPFIAWRAHLAGPGDDILLWCATTMAVLLLRLINTQAYLRYSERLGSERFWRNTYFLGAFGMGSCYGWLAYGFQDVDMVTHVLLASVALGIVAAGLLSHMQHFVSYVLLSTPVFIGMALGALRLPIEYAYNLLFLAAFACPILLLISRRLSDAFSHQVGTQLTLEETKRQLEQAVNAKSRFLANMSHEIRTPINGMLGMAQVLQGMSLNPDAHRYVHGILDSGHRLLGIVNSVLDFSKAEADKLELHPEPTAVAPWLESLCLGYRQLAERKSLRLILDIEATMPAWLALDTLRLGQIVSNLLDNAVKYTEQGAIRLLVRYRATSEHDGLLLMDVEDTGPGMSEAECVAAFEPFVQLNADGQRALSGTGLGLGIVQQLVRLHQGIITVASQPGEGSRFRIELPTRIAEAPSLQASSPDPSVRLSGLHVLLVEDIPLNIELMQVMLESLDIQTEVAKDGIEALERFQAATPHIVLMDCQMPRMDGLEATRRIRALEPAGQHVPIIALTAHAQKDVLDACIAAGMDAHLTKPIDFIA